MVDVVLAFMALLFELLFALIPDAPDWSTMFMFGSSSIPFFGNVGDPIQGLARMGAVFNTFLPVVEFISLFLAYWTVRGVVIVIKIVRRMAWN